MSSVNQSEVTDVTHSHNMSSLSFPHDEDRSLLYDLDIETTRNRSVQGVNIETRDGERSTVEPALKDRPSGNKRVVSQDR